MTALISYLLVLGASSAMSVAVPTGRYSPLTATVVKARRDVSDIYFSPPRLSGFSTDTVAPVAILRQNQANQLDGTFSHSFEADNGISVESNGYMKAISPKEQAQVMQGVYSYTAPDGTPIVTRWYADETGFHAEGAHLPKAAPGPESNTIYQGRSPARDGRTLRRKYYQ